MSKTYIATSLRQLVRERAGRCCEYCLVPESVAILAHQVDHVIAEKHGGPTSEDNLALSCILCNAYKGTDISSLDPFSKLLVPLFNPRSDNWANHFTVREGQVVPLSAVGRATVALLTINVPERIKERLLFLRAGLIRIPARHSQGINRIFHLLEANLRSLESRILAACERSGRRREDVTLVAVTKSVTSEVAALLPRLGVTHLAESRPQELWKKAAAIPDGVRWHFIGHLQRNKIERSLPLVTMIHSADSVRLLKALEDEASKTGRLLPVLLEVNASGEAAKQGFDPSELSSLPEVINPLRHIHVRGLMTMAALQDAEACRPTFRFLRELRDSLRTRLHAPHTLDDLSMGMSNDFEVAIEEGATLIRVGSVLFEGI